MDLRHPLRSLVPSLDWAVLEVLAGTESGLGASQIARLSYDGSRSGQAPILDRLVRQGLVIAEPANQGFLYRLNRDHLLAPAILHTAGIRGRLLELLGERVRQLTPMPLHASVFGSFARGEAGEESDIDLLLIAATDQDVREWESAIELIEKLSGAGPATVARAWPSASNDFMNSLRRANRSSRAGLLTAYY